MTPCIATTPDRGCAAYWPGHLMHAVHASQIGRTPWGWRDGVVAAVAERAVTVTYLDGSASPVLSHHRDLRAVVRVGDLVRVHEQFHALGFPAGWFNCVVEHGAGWVAEPADTSAWESVTTRGAVNLTTEVAAAVDHVVG